MIPKVIPPLTGLTVLVTRPAAQCATLCAEIERQGGAALALPAIEIQPLAASAPDDCDLAVFVSVNAVEHGVALLPKSERRKIAAIGRATAAALAAAGLPADIVPEAGFDSEALLSHPSLADVPLNRVLIVRGEGGRELMRETFLARGVHVATLEVYRRARPQVATQRLQAIEAEWREHGVDFVTLTSAETLHNLAAILSDAGRELLRTTRLLVASARIGAAAGDLGLSGEIVIAKGADDAAMIGAMALWQARAKDA